LDLAHKFFTQFSQDGKYLEPSAFSHFVSFLGEQFSQKDLENLFYLIDTDRNGLISFADLFYEPYSYDSYELELFRFVQNKLKSRSFLSQKLSPGSSATTTTSSEFWHMDLGVQVCQIRQPNRYFSLRRSVSDLLTREIRSRVQSHESSCIITLTFLLSTDTISAETLELFHDTLKIFFDRLGLYFQAPHLKKEKEKSFLIFDGLIKPEEGAIEFLELLNPQLIDGRLDLDTVSEKLGASLQFKTTFAKTILDLGILNTDDKIRQILSVPKDVSFKINLESLADIFKLEITKEFFSTPNDHFNIFIQQLSENKLTLQEELLKLAYENIKNNTYGVPLTLYSLFKVYPSIVEHFDSLQSITLIIKNQILTLDVNFSGLFKLFPKPSAEDLEMFSQVTPPQREDDPNQGYAPVIQGEIDSLQENTREMNFKTDDFSSNPF
jgi:hypothetical protein